eukprot:188948_1
MSFCANTFHQVDRRTKNAVFGYVRRQQRIFDIICNDSFHKLETDFEQLSNLLKNEMKLDGKVFTTMGRKEFGMALAKIKIKTGRSGKLFKHLKCKLGNKEMNDAIRANNLQSYSRGSRDNIAYEQYIVFGYIRRQQNIFDVIYNDVFHNIPMDIAFICALYYCRIELNELSVDEFNVILFEIIVNDDILKYTLINTNKMKEITIREGINGVKFKEMYRAHFAKLYRPSGMKGGNASKIFQKLSKIQADEISVYLKTHEEEKKQNDESGIKVVTLDMVNIEQFSHLFVCVLHAESRIKDTDKTADKLELCRNIVINEKIDGNKCKHTKALKFARFFVATGIKKGPLAKVHKKIINLHPIILQRLVNNY